MDKNVLPSLQEEVISFTSFCESSTIFLLTFNIIFWHSHILGYMQLCAQQISDYSSSVIYYLIYIQGV